MPNLLNLQLDVWSALSHKRTMTGNPDDGYGKPSWMNLEDWRRLCAYKLRLAYLRNVARFYIGEQLPNDHNKGDRDEYREYGDAALLRDQAVAAVLGESQTIAVDGADETDGTPPDEVDQQVAADRQDYLRTWADLERLPAKMLEGERQAVGLGDNVYVLTWDAKRQRPRLRVYDPGLYFPAYDDADDEDFPDRVHLLWEIPARAGTSERPRIRRRTWELAPIGPATSEQPTEGGVLRRLFTFSGTTGDDVQLIEGDRQQPDGTITRRYPWQDPDEPDATLTCYYTDATWDLGDLRGDWEVDTLPLSKATFARSPEGELLDRVDLRLDFLPVIHEPNSVAEQEQFGNSVIDVVAQLLDDLSGTDTDLQKASATTGSPILAMSGVQTGDTELAPGAVFNLGDAGSMTALDTSPNLLALAQLVAKLWDRLSVNSRLPDVALGRIDSSNIPSGVALQLTFAPMKTLIGEMRLVRGEKYPLLLKMVQRIAQAGGALEAGPTPRAELRMGPFMPSDQAGVMQLVVAGVTGGVLALRTGLRMLQEAGVPIEDVQDELDEITAGDTVGARNVFEATGNSQAAAARLRITPAVPIPNITLPAGDGAGAGQQ